MTDECARPDLNDLIGPYVAGRLAPADTEAVELHLLECAACRAEVRTGTAVRKAARKRHIPLAYWLVPASAIAASITLLLFPLGRNPYAELGRVQEPPAFVGVPARSATAGAIAAIDSGMASYARGDYRTANEQLARGRSVDQPGALFFLGVTYLLRGQPAEALEPLNQARRVPDNPYAHEARYYRAKAFLQLELPDSALAELDAIGAGSAVERKASELKRAIRAR